MTPEAGRVWNDNVGDLRNYILELEVKVTTQAETIRQCDKELAEFREDLFKQAETIRRLEEAIANHEEAHRVGLANERAQRETIRRLEGEVAQGRVCTKSWKHNCCLGPATGEGA